MTGTIEFHEAARREFDEALEWYRRRSLKAAHGFVEAMTEALQDIAADPDRCPSLESKCRYWPVRRYPFRIIVRVEGEKCTVVAVAHAKRRPNYWSRRL